MGLPDEWVRPESPHGIKAGSVDWETYVQRTLDAASGATPGFFVKIFPPHLHQLQRVYGKDFVRHILETCDAQVILLTRRDRLRQAISRSKGIQTKQWTSDGKARRTSDYDFDMIVRSYFLTNHAYDFWEAYLGLLDIEHRHFVYEDLVGDPSPFLACVAETFGMEPPPRVVSELKVQRDETTEQWRARFLEELKTRSILAASLPRAPYRNPKNLWRFLTGRQMRPRPFTY
jgi:LPS sulfotransferase NodH